MSSVRTNALKNNSEDIFTLMRMRKEYLRAGSQGSPTSKARKQIDLLIFPTNQISPALTFYRRAEGNNIFNQFNLASNDMYQYTLNEGDEIFFTNGSVTYPTTVVFQLQLSED